MTYWISVLTQAQTGLLNVWCGKVHRLVNGSELRPFCLCTRELEKIFKSVNNSDQACHGGSHHIDTVSQLLEKIPKMFRSFLPVVFYVLVT